MRPRLRRAVWIVAVVASMSLATALVANAFRSNIVFFYSPSQVVAKEAPAGRSFRLGGLVERGSLRREGLSVRFAVSDTVRQVPVRYEGILPDLFKEGKGVVAQGKLDAHGVFVAREVLAKHDENYMPPEAGAALARARAGQMPVEIAVERAK